jgi:DnaK suppressor protein
VRARELLERERERVERELADHERVRDGELSEQEADPAEAGERIEGGEVARAVERRLRAELEAIERAEKRLDEGTYGVSVESGEPIPSPRLEAIPWAERTEEEQKRYERTHGRPW